MTEVMLSLALQCT